ncbi:phosphoglycerate kinase [Patescibacteria group bacterium]|nr:phosphoglycerate kinase [Patescibacteria group bacterium]MBU4353524.1 phosphoglycerate kinase [Patescibacteria group bacterium]MBU4477438.1 phosphoglycerate kinase [Patescibacteria group bacterium]MCG2699399.1 phosphoglycerate kinase [Candidatus Parcubacteria bacterium]
MLPSVKNANVKGKRVILRVDFNVPVEKNSVEGAYRIEKTLPTIEFLRKKGAKIILISHITTGRANGLAPVADYLGRYFALKFIDDKNFDLISEKIGKMKNGDIVLLENIRSYEGEEKNDKIFAKRLASLGDIYVNDAFSASHRSHASIVGVTDFLPSFAGMLFENEFENLKSAFNPGHPFLLILGGIKFESKLGVLEKFLKIADRIFIGGGLANNFFKARGSDVGRSVVDIRVNVEKFLKNHKIILPVDIKEEDGMILDAGDETIKILSEIIKYSKFILWNGPIGDFEKSGFEKGTEEIAKAIAESNAVSIIGGGDTVAAIGKLGILDRFSFVSTAGGAMLEFLAKGTLSGIEALEKSKK